MENTMKMYVTADEAAQILGVSRGYAYKIIRGLNNELKEKGYRVISGKVPTKYFEEKFYGMAVGQKTTKGEKRMADGKRRYKSDRKDYKVSVKLSEKDMDILKAALKRTGMTASAYIRELIRTGGNIDTSYPEDRARAIRVIAGIANNINQAVKLGNSQGRLYYSDIDKLQNSLQNSLDEVKKTFGEVLEVWRLQRS